MKPNFALTFSDSGICLLHRTFSGWARVGDTPFDAPDLPQALTSLRERASHLPGDRSCKLVLPDDQIKYLTIEASGDPDAAVREALDGATPYAVDELEYDWTAEGGVIHIAAVALETLTEAENFAVEHGFEPVSFAASPEDAGFRGEPFFGVTSWAADALPSGTKVERDDTPVRITGEAEMPKATAEPSDESAPVAAAAARAVAEAGPAPKPQKTASAEQTAKPQAKPADASAEDGESAEKAKPKTPATPPAAGPEQSKAPAPKVAQPDAPPAAFSSIRASRTDPKDNTPAKSGATPGSGSKSAPTLAAPTRLSQLGGAKTAAPSTAAPSLPSPASDDVTDPARIAELAASLQPDPEMRLDHTAETAPSTPEGPRGGAPGLFTRASSAEAEPAGKAAPNGAPPKRGGARHADEKQRMTVFGARQSPVRGKPRFLGLILTAILLLFLVGVAAWASVFLEDGLARFFGGGDDIKLADVPAVDEQDDVAAGTDPASEGSTIAPLPGADEPRIASLPRETAPPRRDVAALPNRPSSLDPSEALASYAATGIWQMAPAAPEIPGAGAPVDDIYRVSIDPNVVLGEPASLPRRQPDARDTQPKKPSAPPPPGMRFDFDERGIVRATPEGTLTPEGVRVVAGQPSLMPPADMAQTVSITASIEGTGSEPGEVQTFTGDPALAAIRPRVRPEAVGTADSGDAGTPAGSDTPQTDDETLAAPSEEATRIANAAGAAAFIGDPSLAALRPRPRPASAASAATLTGASDAAVPLVEGAALTRALASAQQSVATPDSEELDDNAFDGATPQAVTASLTPLRRPGDFESIVKRTRESVAATPVPTAQRVQPSMPSSASVAKQATEKNVLNLRQVNLIGVYGSTASRRALVRLGNGRYKKVRVGDTLDGGQVAAIGEGELRYVKRGRSVVLRMPQG